MRVKRVREENPVLAKARMVLLVAVLFAGLFLSFANNSFSLSEQQVSEIVIRKSPLVWRIDGKGNYDLPLMAENKTYELTDSIETDGFIKTITITWKFKGQVTLELSANNGQDYVPAAYGVPLIAGNPQSIVDNGNRIRWRVTLGPDSELTEVRIAYTDASGSTFGTPELSGFKFRKLLDITNPSDEELFNYQMPILVAQSTDMGVQVSCGGRIKADFSDIRFTAADGETLLNYYLESITGDEPNLISFYYVKLPQIPEQGLPIYIYYGNSEAESLSSGEDVFDFFDDFKQDGLDLEKWETHTDLGASYELSGSQLKLDGTKVTSRNYRIKDGIIEYQAKAETGFENRLIIRTGEGSIEQIAYSSAYEGVEHCLAVGDIVKKNQAKPILAGVTYRYAVEARSDDLTFKRYSKLSAYDADNFEAEVDYTDQDGLEQGCIGLEAGEGSVTYYDWLRVRKFAKAEPYISASGEEKNVSLAEFSNTAVAYNGDVVLDSAEGVYSSSGQYITAPLFTGCDVTAITPTIKKGPDSISIDISSDGGVSWKQGCESGETYNSPSDFTVGGELLLRANLSVGNTNTTPQLEEIKLEYSIGPRVTSANISLSGATGKEGVYILGDVIAIGWDNSAQGDNNPDILSVSGNFEPFGGDAKTKMVDDNEDNIYTAQYELPASIKTTANIFVTAANFCGLATRDGHILNVNTMPEGEEEEVALEEEVVEEELLEDEIVEIKGERLGAQLYDVVIKLGDNYNADPEKDSEGSYKHGDVIMIRPSGYLWSETEQNSFLIISLYLTEEEKADLTRPKEISTGEVDKLGRPITKVTKRRAKSFQLEELGLSKTDKRERKMDKVRNYLKKKALKDGVIEEKE